MLEGTGISQRFGGLAALTDVSFRVAGKMIARKVNVGDHVRAGDVIAELDPQDLELEAQSAEAEFAAARSNLAQASADLKRYAADLKLDAGKFNSCLDSSKYAERVRDGVAQGSTLGVNSTPTVYINGRLLSGAQPYEAFAALIDEELARK